MTSPMSNRTARFSKSRAINEPVPRGPKDRVHLVVRVGRARPVDSAQHQTSKQPPALPGVQQISSNVTAFEEVPPRKTPAKPGAVDVNDQMTLTIGRHQQSGIAVL